jgi:hypothetical protein
MVWGMMWSQYWIGLDWIRFHGIAVLVAAKDYLIDYID